MKRACRPPICSSNRRGVSLIELMVVIAVSMFLLTAGLGLIHLLMRAERDGIKDVWHGRSLSRLADAWRRDVRAAGDGRLDDGAPETPRVVLSRPDGLEVAYSVNAHAVSRVASRGGAVEQRDAFYFPPGSTIRLEIDGEPRFARIVIRRPTLPKNATQPAERHTADASSVGAASADSLGRVTAIEALLSRDLRYDLQEALP